MSNSIRKTGMAAIAMASAMAFSSASYAAPVSYQNNFESLDPNSGSALADDGWLVGGCDPVGCYFAFPAPNGGAAFSGVATGEGGATQGNNQLSVYNDYNNPNHNSGGNIEAFVFNNIGTVDQDDVGTEVFFSFDTKQGNIAPPTTARAFLLIQKTSDNSFAELAISNIDTTAVGTGWTNLSTSIIIDQAWVGETIQIGFTSTAANFTPSGVFYDNINVSAAAVPVPAAVWLFGSGLLGLIGVARRK